MTDNAEKRRAAAHVGAPIFGPGVTPNASKDKEWRYQVGYSYFFESAADALTGTSIESGSTTTAATLAETDVLTGTSIESGSTTTAATLAEKVDPLTGTSIESGSTTTAATLVENHQLTGTSIESASNVSTPTLVEGADALTGTSIESGSTTTAATLTETDVLTGTSIESASNTTAATLAEKVDPLTGTSIESGSTTSAATLTQNELLTGVSIESGSTVSTPSLSDGTGPAITQQPADAETEEGGSLATSADADSYTSVQWYSGTPGSGTPLTNGVNVNGSVISGATTDTLSISNMSSLDTGSYYARFTNALGSTDTNACTLTAYAINITGVEAVGEVGGVVVWNCLAPSGGSGYTEVDTSQTPLWIEIKDD